MTRCSGRPLRALSLLTWRAALRFARRFSRVGLPAALGTLFLVLVVLATLQYRWAGELGEAERTRMRAWAQARADAMSRDFDREVTRAFLRLHLQPDPEGRRDFPDFALRYESWRRSTSHPGFVSAVFLVEPTEGVARLSRFDASRRSFVRADWPAQLGALRQHVEEQARTWRVRAVSLARGLFPPEPGPDRGALDLIVADLPALLMPAPLLPVRLVGATASGPRVSIRPLQLSGFLLVVFDLDYVGKQMLPALAERHFGPGDPAYNLVVVRQADPHSVVWRSSQEARPALRGDASAPMLNLRFEEALEGDFEGLASPVRIVRARGAGARSARDERGFSVSVGGVGRPGPLAGAFFSRRLGPAFSRAEEGGHWRLVAAHRAGSVEEVVAANRVRNLAVGFGILVLLGASAAMVILAAQRAARLAERQMVFVAGVSHELRTPVTVICSAADNLADGLVDGGEVRRYGAMLRGEGRRLAQMVEQVLEFAGAGRSAQRREPIEVEPLIERALELHAATTREQGISVVREIDALLPPVRGDAEALGRALQNLVGNALKHGAQGRFLRVTAGGEPGGVRIEVEDRGKGIPPEELRHLFEPFYRGREALAMQVRGFGLGLALAKRAVEDQGGSLEVASTRGSGSLFTIHLPAVVPAPSAAVSEPADDIPNPAG